MTFSLRFRAAIVSLVVQDNGSTGLLTLQPLQLVTLRLLSNGTAAGTWAYNAIDKSMAASDQLYCTYPGTGLAVNYQAGVVYINGTEYVIAAGSITLGVSITGGFIYVDPITHLVASGASLPNNAVAMALFNTSATAVTSLNDAREDVARNLVWGITSDIVAQTSQSTASGGSLEKYARADHKHAMNINLMKAGVVLNTSFAGNPKTFAVAFTTAFADTAYAINISGVDGRTWVYTSKTAAGFTISAQANQALTGEVSWECMKSGESS